MAKKDTKKAAKAIITEVKPVVKEEPIVVISAPEEKPESPNLICTNKECSYTIAKLNNEALVGITCWHCKNGQLMD